MSEGPLWSGRLVQPSSTPERLSQRPGQRNAASRKAERDSNTERPRPLRDTRGSHQMPETDWLGLQVGHTCTCLFGAATSQILLRQLKVIWGVLWETLGVFERRGCTARSGHSFTSLCDLGQGSASSRVPQFPQLFNERVGLHDLCHPLMPIRTLFLMCLTSLPLAAEETMLPSFVLRENGGQLLPYPFPPVTFQP